MKICDVARLANVSIATASRALSGVRTVSPTLVRRVRRVASEIGYVPNAQARALVKGRSRIFGLIVPEITNPFFPEVVQSFEKIAVERQYEIFLSSTWSDLKGIEAAVRRMIERRVDGIAVLTFGLEDLLVQHLRYSRVPLVFVDAAPNVPWASTIRVDYMAGIRQAVQHLAALGHLRIAFVSGPPHLQSAVARKAAFQRALQEIDMDESAGMIVEGDHSFEGGTRALELLFAQPIRPTAVICSNDITAIGVIRRANGRFPIPSQLSLIGFEDVHLSRLTTPPLTTIRMSQSALAELAFRALLERVEVKTDRNSSREYLLNTELILRKTTARVAVQNSTHDS